MIIKEKLKIKIPTLGSLIIKILTLGYYLKILTFGGIWSEKLNIKKLKEQNTWTNTMMLCIHF